MANSDRSLNNHEQLSSETREAMTRRLNFINVATDTALMGAVAERPDLWAVAATPATTAVAHETPAPIVNQAGEAAIDFVQQRENRVKAEHDARIADINRMVEDAHRLREERPSA